MPAALELSRAELLTLAADVVARGELRSETLPHFDGDGESEWLAADRGDYTVVHIAGSYKIRLYRGTRQVAEFRTSFAAGHEGRARVIAEALCRRHSGSAV